jgi:hypothetical protein
MMTDSRPPSGGTTGYGAPMRCCTSVRQAALSFAEWIDWMAGAG